MWLSYPQERVPGLSDQDFPNPHRPLPSPAALGARGGRRWELGSLWLVAQAIPTPGLCIPPSSPTASARLGLPSPDANALRVAGGPDALGRSPENSSPDVHGARWRPVQRSAWGPVTGARRPRATARRGRWRHGRRRRWGDLQARSTPYALTLPPLAPDPNRATRVSNSTTQQRPRLWN